MVAYITPPTTNKSGEVRRQELALLKCRLNPY